MFGKNVACTSGYPTFAHKFFGIKEYHTLEKTKIYPMHSYERIENYLFLHMTQQMFICPAHLLRA
jgi:hypothetical protein